MKLFSIYILCMLVFITESMAASPDWNVNAAAYDHSMVVAGGLNLLKTELANENNMIAAFVGDECRGVANTTFQEQTGRYIAYLLIYSNETDEEVTFKFYNVDDEKIYTVPKTIDFAVNGLIGDLNRPYIWSEQILNAEAEILSFTFPEIDRNELIDGNNIYAAILEGSDISQLKAEFTLSEGATLWLDGVQQISGETINDFTDQLNFTARSEDEQIFVDYAITVGIGNSLPTKIQPSPIKVEENTLANELVTRLKTIDVNDNTHIYTLIEGVGSDDNTSFFIEDQNLFTNITLDFEVDSLYQIKVQSDDGKGGIIEQALIIEVIDLNEAPEIDDYTLDISENSEEGTRIEAFEAYDQDRNQTLFFYLMQPEAKEYFHIDSLSGAISIGTKLLDYESQSVWDLSIIVRDNGDPVMYDTASLVINVKDVIEDDLKAVNTFTPNADGVNDYWYVENVEIYQGFRLSFFNAVGELVFETENYQNNWDAMYNGNPLPEGVYFYVFTDGDKQFNGSVTIFR